MARHSGPQGQDGSAPGPTPGRHFSINPNGDNNPMATATKSRNAAEAFLAAAHEFDLHNKEYAASDRHSPEPHWWTTLASAIEAALEPEAIEAHQFPACSRLIEAYLAQDFSVTDRPTQAILRSWDELEASAEKERMPPETPLQLLALEGMTLEQMAKMLGLPLRTIQRMFAEYNKKKLGEPYDRAVFDLPAGHMTPGERDFMERKVAEAKEFRSASSRWRSRPKFYDGPDGLEQDGDDDWTAPPESPEELLSLPGMTVEQVARMHRMSVDEVQAIATGSSRAPAAAPNPSDDLPAATIQKEVRALAEAEPDLSHAEIAERLGVSPERVTEILAAPGALPNRPRPKPKAAPKPRK